MDKTIKLFFSNIPNQKDNTSKHVKMCPQTLVNTKTFLKKLDVVLPFQRS